MKEKLKLLFFSYDTNLILDIFNEIIKEEEKNTGIILKYVLEEIDAANCYSENSTIYINKNVLSNLTYELTLEKSIYGIIKSLYHEIRHIVQENDAINNKYTDQSFFYICCNLINDYYDKDNYRNNYKNINVELDADIYGLNKLKEFIKKNIDFDCSELLNEIDNKLESAKITELLNYNIDSNKNITLNYEYIPKTLDKIIKNNPDILNKYTNLQLFYDIKGNRKDNIQDILKYYDNSRVFFNQMLLKRILDSNQDILSNKIYNDWTNNYKLICLGYKNRIFTNKVLLDKHEEINNKLGEIL